MKSKKIPSDAPTPKGTRVSAMIHQKNPYTLYHSTPQKSSVKLKGCFYYAKK